MLILSNARVDQFILKPTIFPDGTSQVWKLPDEFLVGPLEITWNFESEREIIDLLSLRKLQSGSWYLHIPFLPYGRQDKEVSNISTFNLQVFADLINSLNCKEVTSVDVHNPVETARLIKNFNNITVTPIIRSIIATDPPDFLVFPDKGAKERYGADDLFPNIITMSKTRDQLTGAILGHVVESFHAGTYCAKVTDTTRFLIVDDLCDGGATFTSIAKFLRKESPTAYIALYVTHGVFSKGREALLTSGINRVYTTNSLTKNGDGYEV